MKRSRVVLVCVGLVAVSVGVVAVLASSSDDVPSALSDEGAARFETICDEFFIGVELSEDDRDQACELLVEGWSELSARCEISEANLLRAFEAWMFETDGGVMFARVAGASECPWLVPADLERIGSGVSP